MKHCPLASSFLLFSEEMEKRGRWVVEGKKSGEESFGAMRSEYSTTGVKHVISKQQEGAFYILWPSGPTPTELKPRPETTP